MRAPTFCVSKQRNVSEFNGALEEGSRGVKNASAYDAPFVAIKSAVDEAGRSRDVSPAALQKYAINRVTF